MDDPIKQLPQEIQDKLDAYLKRIKQIKWFQPAKDLKKEEIDKQVNLVIETFGLKYKFSYKKLKKIKDWDAARGAARGAEWGAARGAARGAAWGAAWGAARGSAWDAAARGAARGVALDAAWDASWGAAETISSDLKDYKEKYPNGSFINLIPIYEVGLWPVGIVDGEFIIAIPPLKLEFPNEFEE